MGFTFQEGCDRSPWQFVPVLNHDATTRDAIVEHCLSTGCRLFATTTRCIPLRPSRGRQRVGRIGNHRGSCCSICIAANGQRPLRRGSRPDRRLDLRECESFASDDVPGWAEQTSLAQQFEASYRRQALRRMNDAGMAPLVASATAPGRTPSVPTPLPGDDHTDSALRPRFEAHPHDRSTELVPPTIVDLERRWRRTYHGGGDALTDDLPWDAVQTPYSVCGVEFSTFRVHRVGGNVGNPDDC